MNEDFRLNAGMRGDIDAIGFSWPTAIKGVRDSQGKLTSLFVVSKTRVPSIPEVPTLAEFGVQAEAGVYAVKSDKNSSARPFGRQIKLATVATNRVTFNKGSVSFIGLAH